MTWSVVASGHTPAPEGSSDLPQPWAQTEQALFDDIKAVLSKPEYGTSAARFVGNYLEGEPYNAPKIDAPVVPPLTEEEEAQVAALLAKRGAYEASRAQAAAEAAAAEPADTAYHEFGSDL